MGFEIEKLQVPDGFTTVMPSVLILNSCILLLVRGCIGKMTGSEYSWWIARYPRMMFLRGSGESTFSCRGAVTRK